VIGISEKDGLSSVGFLQPSPPQKERIRKIVQEDADFWGYARFADGGNACSQKITIVVRQGYRGSLPENLFHGLSPIRVDDKAQLSVEVGTALAARLASLLRSGTIAASFHIPIPLSVPSEIDAVRKKFGDRVYELKGRLLVPFSAPEGEPESIRRGLVGLLGAYSVAWLLAGSDIPSKPIAALVSIFDGEGWGVLGDDDWLRRSSM
jgi:hypothetical protein